MFGAAHRRNLAVAGKIGFVLPLRRLGAALEIIERDHRAVVGCQRAARLAKRALQRTEPLVGHVGLGFEVGDDAVDLFLDLAIDRGQFLLGAQQFGMLGAVACAEISHSGGYLRTLRAQAADDRRRQRLAHVGPVGTVAQLAPRRGKLRLVGGSFCLGRCDLLVVD